MPSARREHLFVQIAHVCKDQSASERSTSQLLISYTVHSHAYYYIYILASDVQMHRIRVNKVWHCKWTVTMEKKLTCWCICKMYFSTKRIKSSSRFCILLSNQCVYETTVRQFGNNFKTPAFIFHHPSAPKSSKRACLFFLYMTWHLHG